MRCSDRAEIWASYNAMPLPALETSVEMSSLAWTIRRGETVLGIFGVGEDLSDPDRGSPWLLATPQLEESGVTFLKQSKACIDVMLDRHSFLENWVDQRNLTSIKWLKWCGFHVCEPAPFGVEQRMFCRFEMRK
jgi:hypothetical protein